jgi:hypothetical protein
MKAINQAFVLAIVTLMSASAFAAGAGETKDVPCQPVATKGGDKTQKASNVQSDEAPAKDSKVKAGEAK